MFSSADLHNFAQEDRIKYQNDMTTERDIQNQIDFARDKGIEIGREEGHEEGLEQGIAQGIAQGIEKGREEERERNQQFIEALKDKGVPEEIIAQALEDIKI